MEYSAGNVSSNPTMDVPEEGVTSEWQGVGQLLWIYFSPAIFIIGCIGNILILVIMARRRFAGTTTCVYLRFMAFFDIWVLITGMIPEWLSANEIVVFKEISPATCKAEKFIHYTFGDTAIWILVAFTIDRFVAVCFPFYKSLICKPRKARIICMSLCAIAITKNLHVIWTRGAVYTEQDDGTVVHESNCGKPEPYGTFEKVIRPWIVFTVISLLPFIIILICNILIIRSLLQAHALHKEQRQETRQDKAYTQMTLMCLSASFAFLFCITPSIILLIGKPSWKDKDGYLVSKAISNQLVYVNHSINFFLYCVTGKRFRDELCRLCRREPEITSHTLFDTPHNGNQIRKGSKGSLQNSPWIVKRDHVALDEQAGLTKKNGLYNPLQTNESSI